MSNLSLQKFNIKFGAIYEDLFSRSIWLRLDSSLKMLMQLRTLMISESQSQKKPFKKIKEELK